MHYLKTAWRSLLKNKGFSVIYILGLAVGLSIAILDGLWIHDEMTFNNYHKNYNHIAQVMNHDNANGERITLIWNPYHLGDLLRKNFGSDFKQVVMSSYPSGHVLTYKDKKFNIEGNYMDAGAPSMLSLEMTKGTQNGLTNIYSIILSESVAMDLFGNEDPINKIIRIENKADVQVTGIYRDLPFNSDFRNLRFIAPWNLYLTIFPGLKIDNPWNNNNFLTYVQIADEADMNKISNKISDLKRNNLSIHSADQFKTVMFLHPMSKWHLYSEFKNGVNVGGRVTYVWLFGIIGCFVLILACINFMNLSTANSQSRAKEIGIRKTIGSRRWQLFNQFFIESLLIVAMSFVLSLIFVIIALPFFNGLADKDLSILWSSPRFWLICLAFSFLTGAAAGLYPALYLSSFQPVKVLKGSYKFSHLAILQRKALVVLQFVVSVILIICTFVVFQQIHFAKSRNRIGYNPDNLVTFFDTPEIHNHINSFRDQLKKSGTVVEVVESTNPTTDFYVDDGNFIWPGKDPNLQVDFPINSVTAEYGKTIGWEIKKGRDFSSNLASDSLALILNEAAVKFMSLTNPIGTIIERNGKRLHIIGVIKNILYESPFQPVLPYVYLMSENQNIIITAKLNPHRDIRSSLSEIKNVFGRYNPEIPFESKFSDQEYFKKFGDEERISKLASFFTILAIFISCLGIFGLATLLADQRLKEIGIRKVLGSSVYSLWALLSRDFIKLIIISLLIASPMAYWLMQRWLQNYPYHSEISWWVFAVTGSSLLIITLLTISYQIIKAAITSPIKILRSE